jgi:hypothetical protein
MFQRCLCVERLRFHTIIPEKCDITLTSKGNTTDGAKYVISTLQSIENRKSENKDDNTYMCPFASVISLSAASINRERQKEKTKKAGKGGEEKERRRE